MQQSVFLVTPPFTQLNTPYPATAYLKGFLNTKNIPTHQADLGILVINELFSRKGLIALFEAIENGAFVLDTNCARIMALKEEYSNTIDAVIAFLQDKNPTLAYAICTGNYLPEAQRFEQIADLEWAFGSLGIRDKARHLSTLYLEDISDLIIATVDPLFGFSRYGERLASSAHSFDNLYQALHAAPTFIDQILFRLLSEKLQEYQPTLFGLSVPFPGNLYSALRCGQYIKQHHPQIKICLGGGYANTELRSLKDARVFEFVDFITLDDGEATILHLIEMLEGKRDIDFIKRTFALQDGKVSYLNGTIAGDYKQADVGTPDYTDLPLDRYLSVIEVANPMHRLWSDGRWNKLTLAHGCYWGKCTFCDISLDYIKNYEATTANVLVDRMEELIAATGQSGFHFVDEAAPPALMREVALEIIRRKLTVTWWTNIRFEKSFTPDLCRLLAASGCIAVSGGLEVASDRLLQLIKKGVTVAQVAKVADSFTEAGIMVHAYMMYGFPTQTAQETIDSLEVVRQLFELNVVQSGFWHQFAMTAHSPVGMNPEVFKVKNVLVGAGDFANNDLPHIDETGCDHDQFSSGLKKALYNYMHGLCFDFPLQDWFDFKIKPTTVDPHYIEDSLANAAATPIRPTAKMVWLGKVPALAITHQHKKGKLIERATLTFHHKRSSLVLPLAPKEARLMLALLALCAIDQPAITVGEVQKQLQETQGSDMMTLLNSAHIDSLKEMGLYIL
ncbi:radical SAM protein [Taibaiella sp. KBW10]|uniref:B12-binding domain-containing radical SAM protein n=1 Tax=Taibaiella sp. KBW10 TaxID=2153357 RepID=UPI000F5AEA74|nr:radical SAM protein [Taibaiella sp. KBW10]RQO32118.1 radical SAM protein [Taibaiella sp. KBW10]